MFQTGRTPVDSSFNETADLEVCGFSRLHLETNWGDIFLIVMQRKNKLYMTASLFPLLLTCLSFLFHSQKTSILSSYSYHIIKSFTVCFCLFQRMIKISPLSVFSDQVRVWPTCYSGPLTKASTLRCWSVPPHRTVFHKRQIQHTQQSTQCRTYNLCVFSRVAHQLLVGGVGVISREGDVDG